MKIIAHLVWNMKVKVLTRCSMIFNCYQCLEKKDKEKEKQKQKLKSERERDRERGREREREREGE